MEFKLKLTFIYFDFPFWRAEVVRIALYYGDIEFDDLRITREEFLRTKKNGYLDDGTMVVVDHARKMNGKTIDISVTSVLQTTAGKMIFGRYDDQI